MLSGTWAPGLAGRVRLGELSYVGIGASIIENLTIGDGVMIEAGSVVPGNVPPYATVVGVPAKLIP